MEKMKKLMALAVVFTVIIFSLAGCGDTSEKSSTTSASSGTLTLDKIKEAGKLVSATEAANEPFEFLENGEIVGYDVDILKYICNDLGVELELVDLPFQGILAGLEAKKYDMVSAALGVTKERADKYALTYPIQEGTTVLIKRKGDDVLKSVEDIKGKVIATQTASYSETDVNTFNDSLKNSTGEGYKELKLYATYPEGYMELKNGRVDAVAQSVSIASVLIKENPDDYEILGEVGTKSYTSWGFKKEDTELYDFFNEEIHKMKENGKLEELQIKWFGTAIELPEENYIPE